MSGLGEVPARTRKLVRLPLEGVKFRPDAEYFATVEFKQKADTYWAPNGYVQMAEQVLLKPAGGRPSPLGASKK